MQLPNTANETKNDSLSLRKKIILLLATCNVNHSSLIERGPDHKAKANVHHLCSPVNSMVNIFHLFLDIHAYLISIPILEFLKLCLALLLAAIQILDTAHSAVLCKWVTS